jgi:hypothetical protein
MTRRAFITLLGGAAAAWPLAAHAQQSGKLRTIGFMGQSTRSAASEWVAAFAQRLRGRDAVNTTTSMGRLTLNVLLSFAQFEREVAGERIRDKFAASQSPLSSEPWGPHNKLVSGNVRLATFIQGQQDGCRSTIPKRHV